MALATQNSPQNHPINNSHSTANNAAVANSHLTAEEKSSRVQEEASFCKKFNQHLEDFLVSYKSRYPQSPEIIEAILYGAMSGYSKRIRPLLSYGVAKILGGKLEDILPVATAVEIIHCYSLIHDDLPAMDDDDIRRGMPSCHKQFSEATAILTGNIMQVIAFDAIIKFDDYSNQTKQLMIKHLINASADIVCGQAMDLRGEQGPLNIEEIKIMHQLKCGVLIKTALLLGALSQPNTSEDFISKINAAGDNIGLAFQIRDDIMDIQEEGETSTGKYKSTYPGILGLEESYFNLNELYKQALNDINELTDSKQDTIFLRYLFRIMTEVPEHIQPL